MMIMWKNKNKALLFIKCRCVNCLFYAITVTEDGVLVISLALIQKKAEVKNTSASSEFGGPSQT